MKIRLFLFSLALLALLSCKTSNTKYNPIGFWSDSTGMALFEIKQEKGNTFVISSSIGALKGQWIDGSVRGVTDLNDSFSMAILSDTTAIYSVLGVQIDYNRVSQAKFDSLSKVLEK